MRGNLRKGSKSVLNSINSTCGFNAYATLNSLPAIVRDVEDVFRQDNNGFRNTMNFRIRDKKIEKWVRRNLEIWKR